MQTSEKQIKQINSQGQKHGYWEEYFNNGQLRYKGNFINGKRTWLLGRILV
jgi:antitoxin component YwqK of YwqJK toxin-antitoxin module